MSTAPPLPTLFGRFTAILKDHDHLSVTLRQLQKMCAALEAGHVPDDPSPPLLFQELLADLSEHFAAEESPDYFGTVVEEAPALAPRIAALKWEHLGFLATVERLLRSAQRPDAWPGLLEPTKQLVFALGEHERLESALLRQLFSTARG